VDDRYFAHESTMRRMRKDVEKSNLTKDRRNVLRATTRFMDAFIAPPLELFAERIGGLRSNRFHDPGDLLKTRLSLSHPSDLFL